MARSPAGLDQSRWLDLWARLGGDAAGRPVFQHLVESYSEPIRAYHNTGHILDCLEQFDLSRTLAHRPDEVEAALWFHDVVYLPGAEDNEVRSARLARTRLGAAGVSGETAQRVAAMIESTSHITLAEDPDTALLCDIDLSILGRAPVVFDDFERRIRQEYGWVPEPVYRQARSEVLAGFLHRRSIYQTHYFETRYESAARANLKRLLAQLEA